MRKLTLLVSIAAVVDVLVLMLIFGKPNAATTNTARSSAVYGINSID
jgi:hypothetical protein